jgi:uncharacterized protein (DUF2235 family)
MKHLIICLDGTWSDGNAPAPQTNIAVLAGIIDPNPAGAPEQRVYYDAGVGTGGLIDRIAGGMFGKGLSANVLAAYRFLCQFYEPGASNASPIPTRACASSACSTPSARSASPRAS